MTMSRITPKLKNTTGFVARRINTSLQQNRPLKSLHLIVVIACGRVFWNNSWVLPCLCPQQMLNFNLIGWKSPLKYSLRGVKRDRKVCVAAFDYKTAWWLALFSHGNRHHFSLLTLPSETSILLYANCRNKLPLLDDTVSRYQFKCAPVFGRIQAFWTWVGVGLIRAFWPREG